MCECLNKNQKKPGEWTKGIGASSIPGSFCCMGEQSACS